MKQINQSFCSHTCYLGHHCPGKGLQPTARHREYRGHPQNSRLPPATCSAECGSKMLREAHVRIELKRSWTWSIRSEERLHVCDKKTDRKMDLMPILRAAIQGQSAILSTLRYNTVLIPRPSLFNFTSWKSLSTARTLKVHPEIIRIDA